MQNYAVSHAVSSSTLSDVLERVLDKGVVIAGDIKVKLVDIELLSLQIRLVICSVDKAKEMGMDWWVNNPVFSRQQPREAIEEGALNRLEERLARLESASGTAAIDAPVKSVPGAAGHPPIHVPEPYTRAAPGSGSASAPGTLP